MAVKTAASPSASRGKPEMEQALAWARKMLLWWLPILYLLVVDSFYLRTYDSAQIKITLVQMGGLCLFTLWASLMHLEGWKAFGKQDWVVLAPFIAYLSYIIFSFYVVAPYPLPSEDDFIRYLFYMSAAMMVIREFDTEAVGRLTKILIIATWITVGYGTLQYIDTRLSMYMPQVFPSGPGNGVDPFIWRGAFGHRVFSTFGNPNFYANFLVLIFPVLVTQFLKTRAWNLMVLTALLLFNLFLTETKGAWVGFAVSSAVFMLTYAFFFSPGDRRKVLARTGMLALAMLVSFALLVGFYAMKRKTSVSFRVLTWLSTWEMIETRPILGNGVGSFKVIYPAFRRPGIFHIEGKHNTETDHAENEFLEQWFDNGIVGFGFFLWIILYTCWTATAALRQLTEEAQLKGARPPPRAYDLHGYLLAFIGMLAHNSFDVSMRFVSSGVFLGLLPGVILALSRGYPLWWLHRRKAEVEATEAGGVLQKAPFQWPVPVLWVFRAAAFSGLAVVTFYLFDEFAFLQRPLSQVTLGGEVLQWWISWTCFWALVLGFGWTFLKLCLLSRSPVTSVIVLAMLYPLYMMWGFFKADVHHNLAIYFSKQRLWDQAIENYIIVNKLNPTFIMPYYFEGNVFNDRFEMNKTLKKELGDPPDTPRDDYERATDAYAKVRSIAPNYVQMHHQMGVLYQKMGDRLKGQGKEKEAEAFYDRALARYKMYYELDPVFPYNYYRMAQIKMNRGQYDDAIKLYREYIEAPRCFGHPGLEDKITTHGHEDAEAYLYLGNAYFLKGSRAASPAKDELLAARDAYQRALELSPGNENAQRNLKLVEENLKGR